ncbi:hypothetical protein CXB51_004860 [Gossypium anomalum]|uniref:Cytochrome P450 n=1 Tax=Gossypium anomalum TaxID=47600 RepID=A0A8J6D7I6_9ROSI|nr:hypothetical protein CXB51_004860 [Gossypium anomalum]
MLLIPFLLLLSLLLIFIKTLTTKKGKLPPGPPKLPILGNLHQLGPFPHRSTWQLSKKHGPIMLLQLGSTPTLVVSSAEAAKEVLKIHDLECWSRPPLAGPKRLTYNFQDVAFAPYGHYWKEMRKICVAELFSMKRVQSFQSVREEEVDLLIESVSGSATLANPVDLSKCSFSLTASIIFRIVFGKQFQVNLTTISYKKWYLRRKLCWEAFVPRIFSHHLDSGPTKGDEEDIVDVLLRMEKDQTQNDAIQLTKDHIKAILMDIFVAGIDTAAISMIWAMAELARKPTAMKKAQNEIRSCVGKKGKLTENDVSKLTYLNMVIKETLRLHPAGVLLLPRETMSQIKIGDYDINPRTRIAVNVWAIGRDPDIWDNPEEFIPESFIDNPIDLKGQHFELLPFGGGRRICPGINMGMTVLELALANLLYFDWKHGREILVEYLVPTLSATISTGTSRSFQSSLNIGMKLHHVICDLICFTESLNYVNSPISRAYMCNIGTTRHHQRMRCQSVNQLLYQYYLWSIYISCTSSHPTVAGLCRFVPSSLAVVVKPRFFIWVWCSN